MLVDSLAKEFQVEDLGSLLAESKNSLPPGEASRILQCVLDAAGSCAPLRSSVSVFRFLSSANEPERLELFKTLEEEAPRVVIEGVWENQRRETMSTPYTADVLVDGDPPPYATPLGDPVSVTEKLFSMSMAIREEEEQEMTAETETRAFNVGLPQPNDEDEWDWLHEWSVCATDSACNEQDGWSYANEFSDYSTLSQPGTPVEKANTLVRRRLWVRARARMEGEAIEPMSPDEQEDFVSHDGSVFFTRCIQRELAEACLIDLDETLYERCERAKARGKQRAKTHSGASAESGPTSTTGEKSMS